MAKHTLIETFNQRLASKSLSQSPEIAGAFDYVDPRRGLLGWVVRPATPKRPVAIAIYCGETLLGHSFAALPRPDIDKVLKTETRAGFALGWHRLDLEALTRIAADEPDQPVALQISGSDLWLPTVCAVPTAARVVDLVRAAQGRPPVRNQGDAIAELYMASQFDHTWYAHNVLGHEASREECLLDYIERGEEAGARPNPVFDPLDMAQRLGLSSTKDVLLTALQSLSAGADDSVPSNMPDSDQRIPALQAVLPPQGEENFDEEEIFCRTLRERGLLDVSTYLQSHPDAAADPWLHFVRTGDGAWATPNPYFDPTFYVRRYFSGPPPRLPFRHYVLQGEAAGLSPVPTLDVAWYAGQVGVIPGMGEVLSHFLQSRGSNRASPNPYFDVQGYLERYPDIRDAKIDAFEHYYNWGQFEGRWGSERFDAHYVWDRYLNGDRSINPLRAFLEYGHGFGWSGKPALNDATISTEIRRNTAPGPHFEELRLPSVRDAGPSVKAFAFYLPQFHAIPENDEWWGTGFTEWRNLGRGVPRFKGHYQPRCPRDLGHYNLLDGVTMRRQVELARSMGLHGFGFYYYNFNGKRLLEKPLDAFCADPEICFPFFLIWANENWTRRWDGLEQDVLLRQDYRMQDQLALVDDLASYMKHKHYYMLGGRPLLCIYRADVIPNCGRVLRQLRAIFRDRHGLDPILMMAQAFGNDDPRPFGVDGAFEFPPHKVGSIVPRITHSIEKLDSDFKGQVIAYNQVVEWVKDDPDRSFPLIRTAVPSWDNDARKQGSGMCLHGSTPEAFGTWIATIAEQARRHPVEGEALIFINAWNEWCEGAYLEPDVHFGHAYINAMSVALRPPASMPGERVLLIGHDAFRSGAQRLLMNIGRTLTRRFGTQVEFLLLDGGDLQDDYREIAPTTVVPAGQDMWPAVLETVRRLREAGFDRAILNTTVTGTLARLLSEEGFRATILVHELPATLVERGLEHSYEIAQNHAQTIVFPTEFVKSEVEAFKGQARATTIVRPQGIYRPYVAQPGMRESMRAALDLPDSEILVLTVGHADIRKAPDIFLDTAQAARKQKAKMHFVWVGSDHAEYMRWIERDRLRRKLDNVSFVGPSEEVDRYLAAADVFFLPSREDPFPTVVLEALDAGLPVVAFEASGGHTDLLRNPDLGTLVPYLDSRAAAEALRRQATKGDAAERKRLHDARRALVRRDYDFADYCADLCKIPNPGRAKVSVVVPNFNYAHHLETRLRSIFAQTHPVFEVIVLDDASDDGSAAVATATAAACGRDITWIPRETNSGSVFRQWKFGLDQACGDFLWIAEADDAADPNFLARLVQAASAGPDTLFAFSDSRALGPDGATLYESYKGYYAQFGDKGLEQDGTFEAREFLRRFLAPRNLVLNASAVVWRTESLRKTFAALDDEAYRFRCAGDWRIYVEACRLGGAVAYVAEPLNHHRRHGASVTHALDKPTHFEEVRRVLDVVVGDLADDTNIRAEVSRYLRDLQAAWKLEDTSLETR